MIFVTGGTGLLGIHLLKSLLEKEMPVKALYRSAIPVFNNSAKVEWIRGDILDVTLLDEVLQGVEKVYHCAAVISFEAGKEDTLFKTNVEGTANVVNACIKAGVKKLLHVSSVAALGRSERDNMIDESFQWSPSRSNSVYGKTKYLAEMEVWRGIGEGLNAVIINPSIILGSGNWHQGSSQIFTTVYNEFPWYTDGATGFVDVADVVIVMQWLMESDISSERFIINAENTTYKKLFDLIAGGFGKKPPQRKVTPLLASLIWRADSVRALFTGSKPLLTRETAASAQSKVYYNNGKLFAAFPLFRYRPLHESIARICRQFLQQKALTNS